MVSGAHPIRVVVVDRLTFNAHGILPRHQQEVPVNVQALTCAVQTEKHSLPPTPPGLSDGVHQSVQTAPVVRLCQRFSANSTVSEY